MKKIIFAIAIVLTLGMTANAQRGGSDGFFLWNNADNEINRDNIEFGLPSLHGSNDDFTAPLGSGLLILTALGAGYAVARKRKK